MTPSVGGFYFGGLIAGVTQRATHAGHRVIALQTFPTRLDRERFAGSPMPAGPWGLDLVDGLIVIINALLPDRLDHVRATGLPVVLIGSDPPGPETQVVLPDNRAGAEAAVEHLLSHGHTRIGFAGDLVQRDIRERYDGYRATLARHGIDADPTWVYAADGNREQGGHDSAQRFLAAGRPTTATLVATDDNAIGFLRVLRGAGLSLPREQAVVAFDHTDVGARLLPRLSTVNPHHDQVGEAAIDQLLHVLDGGEPTPERRIPVSLVVRESCGCSEVAPVGVPRLATPTTEPDEPLQARALLEHVSRTALSGPVSALSRRLPREETRAEWTRTVLEPLLAAASSGRAPTPVQLWRINNLTAALQPHPEALEQCIVALRTVEHELSEGLERGSPEHLALSAATTEALTALSRGCTRPLMSRTGALERTLADQYEVDMDLLSGRGLSARTLTWLPATVTGPACLGLWTGAERSPGDRELEIVGVHGRSSALSRLVGQRLPASQFPPPALIGSSAVGRSGLAFVVPVTSPDTDWGLVAIAGQVESRTATARARYDHWAALLAIALDQERLVEDLQEKEAALTRAAAARDAVVEAVRTQEDRYALWTQALEHGTWDWDVSAGKIYYSHQWVRALGLNPDDIGTSPSEWLDRVHPDDLGELSALIAEQLGGARNPLRNEHRIRAADGTYRWMLCRAVTVRDDVGNPSRIAGALIDITANRARTVQA